MTATAEATAAATAAPTCTVISNLSVSDIVVYTGPECGNCLRTKNYLTSKGLGFIEIDITTDATAAEKLREAGYTQLPVVEAPNGVSWSGMRPDRLIELTRTAQVTRLA